MKRNFLSFFLASMSMFAQNLVPNSSFEKLDSVYANSKFSLDLNRLWYQFFSADLIDTTFRNNTHWDKVTLPHSGDAFAGFTVKFGIEGTSEFLVTKLKGNLIEGCFYDIEFYLRVRDKYRCSNQLGVVFNDTLDFWFVDLKEWKADVDFGQNYLGIDSIDWFKVSGKYLANGSEKYIYIGNFESAENTSIKKNSNSSNKYRDSYYYIDDVKVSSMDSVCNLVSKEVLSTYIFSNINFKPDSFKLNWQSFDELDSLAQYMRMNPFINANIYGHTDSTGSDSLNTELSIKRAYTVYNYLQSKGVNAYRLRYKGFGSSIPISSILSENRRIEIQFIH